MTIGIGAVLAFVPFVAITCRRYRRLSVVRSFQRMTAVVDAVDVRA